jgi:hypothetical protein
MKFNLQKLLLFTFIHNYLGNEKLVLLNFFTFYVLKVSGPVLKKCQKCYFCNGIHSKFCNKEECQHAKVIIILKPGKDDALHFQLIPLLSIVFKLLKRMILQRIQPLIDEVVPVSQAGFRQHCSCTEQVMALTSHIEAGFQHKLNVF